MKKHASYQVKRHTTNHKKYRKLSKTAAVVGSTVTAVSVAAPLMPAVNVQADTVHIAVHLVNNNLSIKLPHMPSL